MRPDRPVRWEGGSDVSEDYLEPLFTRRGVDFTQAPTDQPYGIDAGFRDPSGNHFRMAQPRS